jgi:hypothetical protein
MADRMPVGTMLSGPDICAHVRMKIQRETGGRPMETSIMVKLRQTKKFKHVKTNDERNPNHNPSLYVRV